jgi:hypothetical protein
MIPVNPRLSMPDLPEVISSRLEEDEEDMDPDWLSWGALPGSYGSAGMSGTLSPALANGGPVELGVAS